MRRKGGREVGGGKGVVRREESENGKEEGRCSGKGVRHWERERGGRGQSM